jgi:hypothetical protein
MVPYYDCVIEDPQRYRGELSHTIEGRHFPRITADSSDYIGWSKARRVLLPNIKPSLRTISLRLPEIMLEELKLIANKRDVPYQSLIKIFLSERLSKELNA